MTATISITIGAELPDVTFTWRASDGTLLQFGTVPHTFRFLIDTPTPFVKTTLITFADTDPNVTVGFAVAELDALPRGTYAGELWAKRTSDAKDREPLPFVVQIKTAIA